MTKLFSAATAAIFIVAIFVAAAAPDAACSCYTQVKSVGSGYDINCTGGCNSGNCDDWVVFNDGTTIRVSCGCGTSASRDKCGDIECLGYIDWVNGVAQTPACMNVQCEDNCVPVGPQSTWTNICPTCAAPTPVE